MSHPTLRELTDAVHGFDARPGHVGECRDCRTLESRLAGEFALLRRAEARLAPPAIRRKPSIAPVAYAAAVLLAIIGTVIVAGRELPPTTTAQEKKDPSVEEQIKQAFDGDADALTALRARGTPITRLLADARLKAGETKGSGAVTDLLFDLKKSAAESTDLLDKLDALQVTMDMANAPLSETLDYIREISGMNIVLDEDEVAPAAQVSVKLNNVSLRRILDTLSLGCKFEYDLRYGVLFVSTPERLWAAVKEEKAAPLTEAQLESAAAWVKLLGHQSAEERDKAAKELAALGRAVVPVLEANSKHADKEIASRCKTLLARFAPKLAAGTLPAAGTWKTQKLAKEDEAIRAKLGTVKLDLSFAGASLEDAIGFIRDFTGLNLMLAKGVTRSITVRLSDQLLGNALDLLTLPHGLDAKIEGGVIVIFERR